MTFLLSVKQLKKMKKKKTDNNTKQFIQDVYSGCWKIRDFKIYM